jgi:hypothetical protein
MVAAGRVSDDYETSNLHVAAGVGENEIAFARVVFPASRRLRVKIVGHHTDLCLGNHVSELLLRAGRIESRVKDLIRGALISVAAAACFFAAFVAAALWVPQDQQSIRRHIVAAIVDGTFNARISYGPLGNIAWPRHTLDCLLANMMLAPPASRLVDAMSNRSVALNPSWHDPRVPEAFDCQALVRAIAELGAGYGDVQFVPADRYIQGIRVFGRAMLSMMPFDVVARVMRGVAFALLGAIGVIVLWRFHSAKSDAASRRLAASYAVITGCLALLYGVHYFDTMLMFAPPDYTQFIFIMISLLAPLACMRHARLAIYAASYGSLIAIFESLTGGIPFALAMLPLLLALGFHGDWRPYFAKLILLWGCFCMAVVASFAIKKGFAIAFLGDQESFISTLLYRMYGKLPPSTGVELSLGYLLSSYRRWSGLIAFGSPNIGTGLVVAALGVFVIQTWRTRKTLWSCGRPVLIACWLGVAVLIVWCAAFFHHAVVHPYFMARLLVIPVIGAAVLLTVHRMSNAARRSQFSAG